ncbi:plexin-B2-like isoform X2 [Mytilus californianus]|uniref:plexin-B2-like isoform X2 n=1 Tax=Mytilus californianus TaxID=6549 RepID=UPI002247370F|nr:plexin-B2-like isoform X2 [Mytilus californianus]
MLLVLIVHTTGVLTVTAQMNLAPNGTATQSSNNDAIKGKPENAVNPPISNEYSLDKCSHTKEAQSGINEAWWMFEFSFGTAYITEVTIYYRENSAKRMDGFRLYVTNTPNIPPDGHLCYEDGYGFPTTTQTIPCNNLGQYVIYFDNKGSDEGNFVPGPIIELCYVAIYGCPKSFWGSNCNISCAVNCREQHCFPGNGSCVFGGCSNTNCLNNNCDEDTEVCIEGCKGDRTGPYCNKNPECFLDSKTSVMTCLPKIYQVYPSRGPVNGGTLLTITGKYIGNVTDSISVDVSGVRCHNVTVVTPETSLNCVIGRGTINQTKGIFISVNGNNFSDPLITYYSFKELMIQEFSPKKGIVAGDTTVTIIGINIGFEGQNRYNISFCDIETCIQCSGGVTFTIRGEGFNNVGEITVERMDEPCSVPEDTAAVCETPSKIQIQQNNQTVRVYFDGIILKVIIEYVADPTFERFSNVLEYDKESPIQIKGRNILNLARREDYSVHIGLDGKCVITDIDMLFITCLPPKSVPRTNKTDVDIVHVIVEVVKIMAYIGDLQYTEDDNNFSLIVGLLIGGLVTSVIIGFSAISVLRRNKKRAVKKCKMEMSEGLSERRANLRNDDELEHIEEDEMPYCEINPDDELQSNTSTKNHQDVNDGYEDLARRSQKDPYNRLHQESADNGGGDMTNVDTCTEDLSASGYMKS